MSGVTEAVAVWTVSLSDGEQFAVEAGETLLDAALRAGVAIPYSCRSGTCRTCIARVVTGSVEHDPDYLDDLLIDAAEVAQGYRLLCSSLARSDCRLEL